MLMTIQGLYKMLSCPDSQQLHLGIHVWIEQHINLKKIPSPLRNRKRTSIQGKESCFHRLHIFSFCILQKTIYLKPPNRRRKARYVRTNRKETLPCIFLWLLSFSIKKFWVIPTTFCSVKVNANKKKFHTWISYRMMLPFRVPFHFKTKTTTILDDKLTSKRCYCHIIHMGFLHKISVLTHYSIKSWNQVMWNLKGKSLTSFFFFVKENYLSQSVESNMWSKKTSWSEG